MSVTKPKRKSKNLGGRPRVYASNAARQKAYRDRVRTRRANSKSRKQGQ